MGIVLVPTIAAILASVFYCKATPKACLIGAIFTLCFSILTATPLMFAFGLLMFVASLFCKLSEIPTRRMTIAAMTVAVLLLPVTCVSIAETYSNLLLKKQYPWVSLKERLEPIASQEYISAIEFEIPSERDGGGYSWNSRQLALQRLHYSAVGHFLTSSSFGLVRMLEPDMRQLRNNDESPISIPAFDYQDSCNFESPSNNSSEIDSKTLEDEHFRLQSWFLDDQRMGIVQDVDHVTGFLPHAVTDKAFDFRRKSSGFAFAGDAINYVDRFRSSRFDEGAAYTLMKLQLVGLLYHEEPVVYEIESLPNLATAQTASTRPLDAFETRGLQQILVGNPIYCEQQDQFIRLIGGMRNAESCTQCHAGPSTQLLGAFSYTLRLNAQAVAEADQFVSR